MNDANICGTLRDPSGKPLPAFSTAAQIGDALQVTARTVLMWEAEGKIVAALRQGRVVRFCPIAVAKALGIAR